jgi:hypothetical protein
LVRGTNMHAKTVLILLFALCTTVMSGCYWKHPDPREPIIEPAANHTEATSAAARCP